jgi:thioredoxin-related protein
MHYKFSPESSGFCANMYISTMILYNVTLILDADIEAELAKKFEIRSVPTFILMEDGIEINRITGAKTREELLEFING